MSWYAVYVETGTEELVQYYLSLISTNLHSIIPKRIIPEKKDGIFIKKIKKLYPGYILIEVDFTDQLYQKIRRIPHLIKILGYGINTSPISETEISVILKLIDNKGIISLSNILFAKSNFCITKGPLKGLEGVITKINKHTHRVKVKINIMGKPFAVDLGIQ